MRRISIFVALITVGLLLVSPPLAVEAQEGPVKVGTLLPLTGSLGTYGPPALETVRMVMDQFNEAGGVLGQKLKVVSKDSKSDPTSAVDAAKKLINVNKVKAIIGPYSSGVTMPVAESAVVPGKVVEIAPPTTTPLLTGLEDDDYVFRTIASDEYVGVITGQLALDSGYDSISVIYVNNAYGKGLANAATAWFKKQGGEVVASVPYNMGKSSYRSELGEATKKSSDALVLIAHKEYGSIILRQAFQGGYVKKFDSNFIFSSTLKTQKVVQSVGAKYLAGTLGTAAGSKETPTKDTFRKDFEEQYGRSPETPYMAHSYDAAMVLGLAIQHAGEYSAPAIRDSIRAVGNPPGEKIYGGLDEIKKALGLLKEGKDINYQGAASAVTFNKAGDIVSPILVWKITEDGEIVDVRTENCKVVDGEVVPAKTVEG